MSGALSWKRRCIQKAETYTWPVLSSVLYVRKHDNVLSKKMQQRKEKRCLWRVMKVRTEDLNGWVTQIRGGSRALLYSQQGSRFELYLHASEFLPRCCSASAGAALGHRCARTGAQGTAAVACVLCTAQPSPAAGGASLPRHTCISARGLLFSFLLGDANRQISEYKFKLSKAEQDITTLEQSVSPFCVRCQVMSVPGSTPASCSSGQPPRGPRFLWAVSAVGSVEKLHIKVEKPQETSAFSMKEDWSYTSISFWSQFKKIVLYNIFPSCTFQKA